MDYWSEYLATRDWADIRISGIAAVSATIIGVVLGELFDWWDRIKAKR